MSESYLPSERHLHAVPVLPNPLPWWCRTFGHTFTRPDRADDGRWYREPTPIMCRRCGTRP